MFATRASQQAMRQLAASRSPIAQMGLTKLIAPAVLGASVQTRFVATQKLTPANSADILIAQRKLRPTSPHLAIYKWQIPWILSITNRITGAVLSGGFYIFGSLYLVAPLFGWHIDSASMAAAFGSWPIIVKLLAKFAVALPFTFHSFNGIRHLVWDAGAMFANKNVIKSGWTIVGLSAASALGLSIFL